MPIPYHIAAERAQSALYQLDVVCECPECDEETLCVVYGDDVELDTPCINGCAGERGFDRDALYERALSRAACERMDYISHLRTTHARADHE
jgi:hypothetical protein